MRHISISLLLAPNPVIEEPTTYKPQAKIKLDIQMKKQWALQNIIHQCLKQSFFIIII